MLVLVNMMMTGGGDMLMYSNLSAKLHIALLFNSQRLR